MTKTLLLADDSVTIQRVIELTFADEDVAGRRRQRRRAGDRSASSASRPTSCWPTSACRSGTATRSPRSSSSRRELAHIPVLLLTGAFEPVDEARARAVGCDGVLVKPFEPQHGDQPRQRAARRQRERRVGAPAGVRRRAAAGGRRRRAPAPPSLDDYFDRLDAAFASDGRSRRRALEPVPPRRRPAVTARPIAALDRRADADAGAARRRRRPSGLDRLARRRRRRQPEAPSAPAAPRRATPPTPPAPPPKAVACATRSRRCSPPSSRTPAPAAPTPRARPRCRSSTDDARRARSSRRVLARLSDRVVRETVADIVLDDRRAARSAKRSSGSKRASSKIIGCPVRRRSLTRSIPARSAAVPEKPALEGLEAKWTAALGSRRRLPVRPHASARRGLLDRHAAADGQRLAARRPRLLVHAHRRHRALPADARQGRVLSDGVGRQRPADRAARAELLRRALRSVAAVRPVVRAAGEAGQAADLGLAAELHRAVRRG